MRQGESGNIIFFVLLAVALIGLVTAAIRSGSDQGANIDRERLLIRATEVRAYATELERGVVFIMQNGISTDDIRFAHPDAPSDYGTYTSTPEAQVFHPDGGAAEYRDSPAGVQTSDTPWHFFGHSRIPGAGTDRGDLIAVLPNVTRAFCDALNKNIGLDMSTYPADDAAIGLSCVMSTSADYFDSGTQYTDPGDPLDVSSFDTLPALQACVVCPGTPDTYHFYHTLVVR